MGWNVFFENQLKSLALPGVQGDFLVGRVAVENKTNYLVLGEQGEFLAEITGRLFYTAASEAKLPKVGDWVLMSPAGENRAIIHQVFERKSTISRKVPGKRAEEQVLATNVDRLFIVQGLDGNFNLARLERYLALAGKSKAVVVLNKADLAVNLEKVLSQVKERIGHLPVVCISALQAQLGPLRQYIEPGATVAFVGSSGVGKSTLINGLLGEKLLATGPIRASDSKGRHTSTRREMVVLPGGGILIDTPGMRELQLWDDEDMFSANFSHVEAFFENCRFSNCTHQGEPGCAIAVALGSGELLEAHWQSYLKMKRELEYLASRTDQQLMHEKKQQWKKIHKNQKQMYKNRNKDGGR